ncbi:MAG: acyl-CoA dehydratase activase [Oscillibacter sp.]|jgi:predicted CoA-substrate-specific enzyme activase|nr:acyl-CoA dehydratase activase [Oscillibacter sp.]
MPENKFYYVCKYTPLEMLSGFGAEAVRLDVAPANFDCADECSHPNLCGYGKSVIEAVAAQNIRALILTDCCDVMRRVYDVLKARGTLDFLELLPLPHKRGSTESKLFADALERLAQRWAAYSGQSFDSAVALSAWENGRAEAVQAQINGPHISLTGAHGGKLLYDTVTSRFRLPVTDDTCTGRRELPPCASGKSDAAAFYSVYAPALLGQARPCLRMLDCQGRATDETAVGVICHTVKFCDYYSFEYRNLKANKEVPLLKIETDCTPQSAGQLHTRLDAFAETLHAVSEKVASSGPVHYAAGVDSGSTSTDAVVMDAQRHILGSVILPTGAGAAHGAEQALTQALAQAGLSRDELDAVVTTGYGRETIGLSDSSVTEITCHAKGAHFLRSSARTVIDIGGQDSKVIRIDENGNVRNFIMNDKCAAGTGRFLDMMARTLGLTLGEMSALGLQWKNEVNISSMCTVFAESEVVSLVADNTSTADIIHGLNRAVAGKTAALAKRLGGEPEYIMTGGVAQNQGVVLALGEKLGCEVYVPAEAQLCGAIGAALIALGD